MAEQDPITRRAEREDTLAGLLGGAWLSWSNVPSPSVLKLDDLKDIFRANEIIDQSSALWNDAYSKTLSVTGASMDEDLAALMFLLFFESWSDDLSTRWNARVENFLTDQKSDSPRLPAWEYVRGKGGLLLPRDASQEANTTTKPSVEEADEEDIEEEEPAESEEDDSTDTISDRVERRKRKRRKKPKAKYSKPLVTPSDFKAESIALIVNGYTDGQLTAAEQSALQGAGGIDLIWMCEPGHCFVAGTPVATRSGNVPIESLKPGDLVMTRRGLRRVRGVQVQLHKGRMVQLVANGSVLTCTADHLIHASTGWVPAKQIRPTDKLKSIEDQLINVDSVFNFNVGDPNDSQSHGAIQIRSLPSIFDSVLMPVESIDFNRHSQWLDKKINGVSTSGRFLDERNANAFKTFSDDTFVSRFAPGFAIAGFGAEAGLVGRPGLFGGTADFAVEEQRRASACFRAVMAADTSPFSFLKIFAATLADRSSAFADSAFKALLHGHELSADSERLSTFARAINEAVYPAVPRTESSFASGLLGSQIEGLTASCTVSGGPASFSLGGSEPQFNSASRHGVLVYDLEIEGDREFYANGILVHNCDDCGQFCGRGRAMWSRFNEGPQLHRWCRCWLKAVKIFSE